MERLLITGGSGLVGYALKKLRPSAIYVSSKDYDLTKEREVKRMFERYRPVEVIHLAAKVGGIADNIEHQADFFYQNLLMNTYVLHYAYKYDVKKLIATISNCAYPDSVAHYPMKEEDLHNGPPTVTNFSYAYAKRAEEVQVQSYRKQYHCSFFSVIPCSLYGPNDKFGEKSGHFVAVMIRKAHEAKIKKRRSIKLLGTGKPLRQYMFSMDLAKILLLLMDEYEGPGPINIASKENLSIKEIAEVIIDVVGCRDVRLEFDNISPDGQFRKDLSSEKLFGIIKDFRMTPFISGIKATYAWYLDNYGKTLR